MVTVPDNGIADILIYGRIERDLRQRIAAGEWPVGSAIPGRRRLATLYNVAVGTVEHAVAALLADGTLQVVEGRGTFVRYAQPKVTESLERQESAEPTLPLSSVNQRSRPYVVGLISAEIDIQDLAQNRYVEWAPITVRAIERSLATSGGHTCLQVIPRVTDDLTGSLHLACLAFPEVVDALILIDYSSEVDTLGKALFALHDQAAPLICITWGDLIAEVPHLYFNNRYMGYQAACHLLLAGYSRIVYLSPHPTTWADERYQGICTAVQQYAGQGAEVIRFTADVPFDGVIPIGEYEILAVEQFLARPPYPLCGRGGQPGKTGIITSNDAVARTLWTSAAARGITPGHDYGLLGFDDRSFARELGLTSMRPPLERMGEEAVRMVTRILEGEAVPNQIRLQADLMPRMSTLRR